MLIDFKFTPDVAIKLDQALTILKQPQSLIRPKESGGNSTLDAQATSSSTKAIKYLLGEGVEFQDTVTRCNGEDRVRIFSAQVGTLAMKPNVPQQFLRDLHEYHLMCNINS